MVLGFVVMLTTAATVYNKNIQRQIIISREHAKVLGMFIKARSSGLTIPKADSGERICGFGVHIDTTARSATYFKDVVAASSDCSAANHIYDGAAEKIDELFLNNQATFGSSGLTDVVFIPPSGSAIINNDPNINSANITLNGTSFDLPKYINVTTAGQITEATSTTP